jgi:uncharacterized protein (TIGR03437 family)
MFQEEFRMKLGVIAILTAGCLHAATPSACPAVAPASTAPAAWDNSGNSLLAGKTYFFRYVQYTVGDQRGNLSRAIALYKNITFNAGGTYTINGMEMDSNSGQTSPCTFTGSGAYSFSSSGFGFLTNPVCPGDQIWGTVAKNGVFAGSTTETQNGYNDLFIGAPTSAAVNSTLMGAYSVAYMNFPDGYAADTIAAGFQMNPDGQGSIGNVNILAYQGNKPGISITEGVSYSFSDESAVLAFPGYYGDAITGAESLYITPDSNFVFGGSPTAWDFFVGVRTGSGTSGGAPNPLSGAFNFAGVYSQAGIDETISTVGGNVNGAMQTYYGAFEAVSGTVFDHQRILAPLHSPSQNVGYPSQAFSATYTDKYVVAFDSNGGYTDTATNRQYVIGAQGDIRIGFGISPALGISVAFQSSAPARTGAPSAVYINPTGVVNSASYAPYTSGVSPGELIVIFGSNFATSGTLAAPPYPTSVANVQVTINGLAAQIAYVYPGQIAVVVPLGIEGPYAQIQVVANGTPSNTVWELVNLTTPGVFSQSENGLGDAVVLDANLNRITPPNSAQPNQTVSVFLTGLGSVNPATGLLSGFDGTTYSPANTIIATIGGIPAAVTYPNLSPLGSGLYQIGVTIPSGVTGDLPLIVSGPDSQTAQTTICVVSCAAH